MGAVGKHKVIAGDHEGVQVMGKLIGDDDLVRQIDGNPNERITHAFQLYLRMLVSLRAALPKAGSQTTRVISSPSANQMNRGSYKRHNLQYGWTSMALQTWYMLGGKHNPTELDVSRHSSVHYGFVEHSGTVFVAP